MRRFIKGSIKEWAQEVILIIEGITDIMHEVVRGIERITMITEGIAIEVKVMKEMGVGH